MLAFLFGCESKEGPGAITPPEAAPEEEVVVPQDTESYYIEDDIDDPLYWVTNEYMQAFMQEVKYRDNDYNYTSILDYDGGGPGEADIPPTVTLEWENKFPDKKLLLTVWDKEWSREYSLGAGATSQELLNQIGRAHV